MAGHEHPVFTRVYGAIAALEEGGAVGQARTTAAKDLHGTLLIVGLGPGHDLLHLPDAVTEVVAIEPSASMRATAAGRVAAFSATGRPIRVVDAVAEDLPLPDDSVDSVLFVYVLCTVEDPARALAETRRVLRPGGVVGMLEHVRGKSGSWSRRSQSLVSWWWPALGGGCHCDRETRAEFDRAGFDLTGVEDTVLVNLPPVAPAILGTARLGSPPGADGQAGAGPS